VSCRRNFCRTIGHFPKKDYRKIGARGPCLKEENQVKKYVEDQQSNIYLGMHIVGS
jgi:hypothetical protein